MFGVYLVLIATSAYADWEVFDVYPFPDGRDDSAGIGFEDLFIVMGGKVRVGATNDLWSFNTSALQWTERALTGYPVPPVEDHWLSVHEGDIVVYIGKDVLVVPVDSGNVSLIGATGDMPPETKDSVGAVLGDVLVVFAGVSLADDTLLDDLHTLDMLTGVWMHVPKASVWPRAREDAASCVYDASLFVHGGALVTGETLDDLWKLSAGNTWTPVLTGGSVPLGREDHVMSVVGNTIVLFGGSDLEGNVLSDLAILDMETLVWVNVDSSLPPGHWPFGRKDFVGGTVGDVLFIAAGDSEKGKLSDIWRYDPDVCPLACSGHGRCARGQCACIDGFVGGACHVELIACLPGWVTPSGHSDLEHTCTPCPPGTHSPGVGGTQCLACAMGTHSPSSNASVCSPCSPGMFAPATGLDSCLPCQAGEVAEMAASQFCSPCTEESYQPLPGQRECTRCPPLSSTHTFGSTSLMECICVAGSYKAGDRCEACPAGAYCSGRDAPAVALPGFYGSLNRDLEEVFIACDKSESCIGASECDERYAGFRCGKCKSGSSFSLSGSCSPCNLSNKSVRVMLAILTFLVPVVAVVLFLRSSSRLYRSGSITIAVDFLQTLMILLGFRLNWRKEAVNFATLPAMFFLNFDLLATECTMHLSPLAKFYTFLMSPAIIMLVVAIVFGVSKAVALFHRQPPVRWMRSGDYFINAMFLALSLLYASLATTSMSIFRCISQADGHSYVDAMPYLRCGSSEWLHFLPGAVLGIVLYVVGIPVLFAAVIYNNRHVLFSKAADAKFGTIYVVYTRRAAYWDGVLKMKKCAFILLTIVFRNSVVWQALFSMVILVLQTYATIILQPFRFLNNNHVQVAALTGTFMCLFVGVAFAFARPSDEAALLAVFFMILIAVLVVLAVAMAIEFQVVTSTPLSRVISQELLKLAIDDIEGVDPRLEMLKKKNIANELKRTYIKCHQVEREQMLVVLGTVDKYSSSNRLQTNDTNDWSELEVAFQTGGTTTPTGGEDSDAHESSNPPGEVAEVSAYPSHREPQRVGEGELLPPVRQPPSPPADLERVQPPSPPADLERVQPPSPSADLERVQPPSPSADLERGWLPFHPAHDGSRNSVDTLVDDL